MADVEKTAVLKVEIDFGDLEKNQQTIASKINDIRNEQLKLDVSTKENQKTFKGNAATLRTLEQQQKLNQKSINDLTNAEKANTDTTNFNNNSIKQNRELLKGQTAEYIRIQNPTKAQTENLKKLTDTLKKQESAIGDNRRNVGNYAEGFRGVISTLPGLGQGLGGIANGFKAISASNPFGLILLVLQPLLASFLKLEPVTNTISGIFEGLTATITTIVTSVKNFFDLVSSGAGLFSAFSQSFSGLGSRIADAATQGYNLVQALDDLEDAERRNQGSIAQTNRDTAILIAQSKDRTKSEKERIALLERANDLEEAQLKRDITLAFTREKLAAAQLATIIRNGGDRDKAEQDLEDARAARFAVQQAFGTQTEKSQGRINGLIKEETDIRAKATEKAAIEAEKFKKLEAEKTAKLIEEINTRNKRERDNLVQLAAIKEQQKQKDIEEQNAKSDKDIADFQKQQEDRARDYQLFLESNILEAETADEFYNAKREKLEEENRIANENIKLSEEQKRSIILKNSLAIRQIDKDERDARIKNQIAVAGALQNLSTIIGETTEAGKAFAVASTIIGTYAAAQQAFNSQVEIPVVGPILGAIAAAAAIVAGLTRVRKIQSVDVPGFAEGGIVSSGMPIQRSNGDNRLITAKVNEVVLTETQQARLGGAPALAMAGVPGFAAGGSVPSITGSEISSIRQMSQGAQNLVDKTTMIEALRALNISVAVTEIQAVSNRLDLQAKVAEL